MPCPPPPPPPDKNGLIWGYFYGNKDNWHHETTCWRAPSSPPHKLSLPPQLIPTPIYIYWHSHSTFHQLTTWATDMVNLLKLSKYLHFSVSKCGTEACRNDCVQRYAHSQEYQPAAVFTKQPRQVIVEWMGSECFTCIWYFLLLVFLIPPFIFLVFLIPPPPPPFPFSCIPPKNGSEKAGSMTWLQDTAGQQAVMEGSQEWVYSTRNW